MELIQSSAYLRVCECGKHAHFVLADGTTSSEFCSKEKARTELEQLGQEKKVSELEAKFLESQISESSSLWALERHAPFSVQLLCEISDLMPFSFGGRPASERVM